MRISEFALSAEDCALISRFLRGAQRLTVRSTGPAVPPWDLDVVLGALQSPPFELLGGADLRWLSIKTAFLLAVTSARRVSELHALSVHDDCCRFSLDGSSVVLRPNPAFLSMSSLSSTCLSRSSLGLSPLPMLVRMLSMAGLLCAQ